MPSYIPPKKNTQFVLSIGLVSQADTKILQVNPTLAAGDFQVSTDGGALGNLGTLPTVTPAGGRMVICTLSAGEMNGDMISFIASDAAGAEWCDLFVNIHTSVRQVDDLLFPTVSGRSLDVTATGEGGIDCGNVGSPTTLNDLTNTSIGTASTMTTAISIVGVQANAISTASFAAGTTMYGVTTVTQGMTVVNLAANAIAAASAVTDFFTRMADIVMRRQYTNIRTSSDGETVVRGSLLGAIAKVANRVDFSLAPLATIYHENGSTSFYTQTLTTSTTAAAVVQVT